MMTTWEHFYDGIFTEFSVKVILKFICSLLSTTSWNEEEKEGKFSLSLNSNCRIKMKKNEKGKLRMLQASFRSFYLFFISLSSLQKKNSKKKIFSPFSTHHIERYFFLDSQSWWLIYLLAFFLPSLYVCVFRRREDSPKSPAYTQ